MSDKEKVQQALAELWDVVKCRCDEAYRDRGLKDPHCECDSAEAVKVVASRIKALTEQLAAARDDAKEAEAYAEEVEREQKGWQEAAVKLMHKLTASEAKLAKAVEALDDLLEAITAEDRLGDRSLTITGPTANLKWLIEAEDTARAALTHAKETPHE